jgi:hypothetical protein
LGEHSELSGPLGEALVSHQHPYHDWRPGDASHAIHTFLVVGFCQTEHQRLFDVLVITSASGPGFNNSYRAESDFGVNIPNSLAHLERHSWAISTHTTTGGQAMDYPLKLSHANMTSRLVRFSGFYHAQQSGAPFSTAWCGRSHVEAADPLVVIWPEHATAGQTFCVAVMMSL